jgi:hypothetical protein
LSVHRFREQPAPVEPGRAEVDPPNRLSGCSETSCLFTKRFGDSVRDGYLAAPTDQALSHVHNGQYQSDRGARVTAAVEVRDDHKRPKILDPKDKSPLLPRRQVTIPRERRPECRADQAYECGRGQGDCEHPGCARPAPISGQFGQPHPCEKSTGDQASPPRAEEADFCGEDSRWAAEIRVGELSEPQPGEILRTARAAKLIVRKWLARQTRS